LALSGSSARMAEGCQECPVDTVVVAIVDDLSLDKPAR
jgi:microcompartment protein CcmK/EutM